MLSTKISLKILSIKKKIQSKIFLSIKKPPVSEQTYTRTGKRLFSFRIWNAQKRLHFTHVQFSFVSDNETETTDSNNHLKCVSIIQLTLTPLNNNNKMNRASVFVFPGLVCGIICNFKISNMLWWHSIRCVGGRRIKTHLHKHFSNTFPLEVTH